MRDPLEDILGTSATSAGDPLEDILGAIGKKEPEFGSAAQGMAARAIHSGTLHADSYFTTPEYQKKLARFAKTDPIKSGIGDAAGFIAPMLTPVGWASRVPMLAKVAEYLLPFANFQKSVTAGSLKGMAHEGGKGALKAGAMMRFNDPPPKEESSGDTTTDTLRNIAKRGQKAGDLTAAAWDYGLGAPGAVVGNKVGGYIADRVADVASKASLGAKPSRGATLDIAHELKNDSPGGNVDETIKRIRDLVYGENRTLGRHGGGAIPQEAEREMARQFHKLTTEKGLSDAEAERVLGRYWQGRSRAAERTMTAGSPSEDAWLLSRGGNAFQPSTMGGWGRAAGTAYRERNAVPSNVTELAALATGGEAPALQTTLKKLLNLKSEGGARSDMLRAVRERQKGIKPQLEQTFARHLGDGDVKAAIAQRAQANADANAQYPEIFQGLKALGPEAEDRLRDALHPVIQDALKKAGVKTDNISEALRANASKWLETHEAPLSLPSMQPLTSPVTKAVKDAAGNIIGKEQRQVPLTRYDAQGRPTSQQLDLGVSGTTQRPPGDLEAILDLRRALDDEVGTAFRGGSKNLGTELRTFKESIDKALRGLAGDTDEFGRLMGKWGAANDARAYAGRLERTYQDAVGLNLSAKKGESLMDLERFLIRFRRMDDHEKDIARQGVMSQFKAMLETGGDLHDAAKVFSNQRTRQVLTEMLGPKATEELGGFVARAGLATNTFGMNRGSPTASILDADKGSGWLSSIAGALWHGNPVHAIGKVGEMAGDAWKRQKHGEMTKLLSASTDNPMQLEAVLRDLTRAAAPVNQRLQNMAAQARTGATVFGATTAQPNTQ